MSLMSPELLPSLSIWLQLLPLITAPTLCSTDYSYRQDNLLIFDVTNQILISMTDYNRQKLCYLKRG